MIQSYAAAAEYLKKARNPEDGKPVRGVETRCCKVGENYTIRYRGTDVVIFLPGGNIILNTGGWRTATTKKRMNDHTPPSVCVYQHKKEWFVSIGNSCESFLDTRTIKPE